MYKNNKNKHRISLHCFAFISSFFTVSKYIKKKTNSSLSSITYNDPEYRGQQPLHFALLLLLCACLTLVSILLFILHIIIILYNHSLVHSFLCSFVAPYPISNVAPNIVSYTHISLHVFLGSLMVVILYTKK